MSIKQKIFVINSHIILNLPHNNLQLLAVKEEEMDNNKEKREEEHPPLLVFAANLQNKMAFNLSSHCAHAAI